MKQEDLINDIDAHIKAMIVAIAEKYDLDDIPMSEGHKAQLSEVASRVEDIVKDAIGLTKYYMESLSDVEKWLNDVIGELAHGFHVDTCFSDYYYDGDFQHKVYSNWRVMNLWRDMAVSVCQSYDVDIYEWAMIICKKKWGRFEMAN